MTQAVQQFISSLYVRGVEQPPERFRRWALSELQALVPFDAAVWGSGTITRSRFHTVTVTGVSSAFAGALEATQQINPLLPAIQDKLGEPIAMSDVFPDRKFFRSDLYRRTFEPFGIARILSSANVEPRSGLYTLLSIYRFERRSKFTAEERRVQAVALHHLIQAAAHVFFQALQRPSQATRGLFRAVVDAEGVFHVVEDGFMDLLESHWPGWGGHQLPFDLPPVGFGGRVGNVHVSVRPFEDLSLLELRECGPLDELTERERDVVGQVCQGLSAKAIGRGMGLAPSTVSTHLYRAYRKLGVDSRTELAKLFQELS